MVTDWVKVRYNEARYGRSDGFPCAGNVCSNTWNLVQRRASTRGSPTSRPPGKTDAQIEADARQVRRVGPLRLRRRRQLQRARRLHRPLPDRPRRWRPGRRRPAPGRGRDLVPPLARVPGHRHRRPARQPARRHAGRRPPASGSATTPSSRRTAASSVFAHEYGHDLGLPDHYDTSGGGEREPGQLVEDHGPEPRSAQGDNGIGDRGRPTCPRGTSSSSAGSTTRSSWPAQGRTLELGPHEYNTNKARRSSSSLPDKAGHHNLGPRRRRQPVVERRRRRLQRHDDPPVNLPAGHRDADASRRAGTSRTAARTRATTPTSRSTTAPAQVDRGLDHQPRPRATASTVTSRPGRAGDVRPVRLRGKTIGLRFRYTTDGAVQGQNPDARRASSSTTIRVTAGSTAVFRTVPRPVPTAGPRRLLGHRRARRPGVSTSSTSPRTGTYVSTTSTSRRARTTSGSRTGRTSWSTSRTRTACSSRSGTPRSGQQHQPAPR